MTLRSWDVVVVGGALTDFLVQGERLPGPGEAGELFTQFPGGKGANQAMAAARLGARVALVARVGNDERGAEILRQLEKEGIDTRYVFVDPDVETGLALIAVNSAGSRRVVAVEGANRRLSPADVDEARLAIRSAPVLLTQLEVPLETLTAALGIAKQADRITVLDAAPAMRVPDAVFPRLDLITCNALEAHALTGIDVHDRVSAHAAGSYLLARGAGAAAIQAGHEGKLVMQSDGRQTWLTPIPVRTVDTTGAGDAFAATLAVLLGEGDPVVQAAPYANAAAALTTTGIGALRAFPRRDAIMALVAAAMPDVGALERGPA